VAEESAVTLVAQVHLTLQQVLQIPEVVAVVDHQVVVVTKILVPQADQELSSFGMRFKGE
jgi:hypothetical protein